MAHYDWWCDCCGCGSAGDIRDNYEVLELKKGIYSKQLGEFDKKWVKLCDNCYSELKEGWCITVRGKKIHKLDIDEEL